MSGSDIVERVCAWNESAGNSMGDRRVGSWVSVWRQYELLKEEFHETRVAIERRDVIETVDGCVDVMVVAVGLMHRLGLTEQEIKDSIDEILSANESKFTADRRVARDTVEKFRDKGVEVEFSDVSPYVGKVIRSEDQKTYPIGKIIKSLAYTAPNLSEVLSES